MVKCKLNQKAIYSLIDYPLKSLHTFNVPAFAAHYIRLNRLKEIYDFCAAVDIKHTHFYILGGGSNTLFSEQFSGYVLHVQLQGIEVIKETDSTVLIKVAAGVLWHKFVLFCMNKGYGGIENLSLIPGTVGGAPIQNIGAYGVELKDVLHSIEAIELSSGKTINFQATSCGLGYRTSFFKTKWRNQYLITTITLMLHKEKKFCTEHQAIQAMLEKMDIRHLSFKAISDVVIQIRKEKLPNPSVLGNAGSFFQNPLICLEHYKCLKQQYPDLVAFEVQNKLKMKISAAWLIEAAGFKGIRKSQTGVYSLHALILVNYGGATSKDIINLAIQIQEKVKQQFNITLIPEVNIVNGVME